MPVKVSEQLTKDRVIFWQYILEFLDSFPNNLIDIFDLSKDFFGLFLIQISSSLLNTRIFLDFNQYFEAIADAHLSTYKF